MKYLKLHRWFKILFIALILISVIVLAGHIAPKVFAQGLQIPHKEIISSSIPKGSLGETVLKMVNYFLGFLGLFATLAFIYAGVLWVLSGGAEESISKAKKILTYASLGIVVILLSYSAVTFITRSAGTATVNCGNGTCDAGETSSSCPADCGGQFNQGCLVTPCDSDHECWLYTTLNSYICIPKSTVTNPPDNTKSGCPKDFQCTSDQLCVDTGKTNNECVSKNSTPNPEKGGCPNDFQCTSDQLCADTGKTNNECVPKGAVPNPNKGGCPKDFSCASGQLCVDTGKANNECVPIAGQTGIACSQVNPCPTGFSCIDSQCVSSGAGNHDPDAGQSEPPAPDYGDRLDQIEETLKGLAETLDTSMLTPEEVKNIVDEALQQGADDVNGLSDKIDELQNMLNDPTKYGLTEEDIKIIEALIGGLERLKILRAQLDDLRLTMPESKAIIQAYDETSIALDDLIADPTNGVKFSRFDTKYKILKQLIKDFPYVKSVIWATPVAGNVPFTVQLDGMDSSDPTGGTISDYRWTYIDSSGGEVSLGTGPVIIHDFTEVNTYAVKLRVSTSQKDADGYKTAADGVSRIRIKAYPPTSQVKFRINGKEVGDIFNVTFKEAQAGLSFDPSQTTAALGRKIEKYEWSFGDGTVESRYVPTTVVHTYEKTGDYNAILKVTDNIGVTDKIIVKIFVKSIAADIIVAPEVGDVNTTFSFQGIASRTDDGTIQSYQWEINDSNGKTLKQSDQKAFSYKFIKPGKYNVVITVADLTGAKDKFTKTITVISRPPVTNFTFSIPQKNHPNRIEFNAIDSYDPDEGDSIKYSWDFDGDGKFDSVDGKEALITHEYSKVGEYRAKLQVTDAYGQYSQTEKKVSIDSVLSADIVSEKRATHVGEEIKFEAKSPNSVAYLWEFGDGETQSAEDTKASHTYKKVGKFAVKLNFFDKEDNSNSVTQHILVGAGEQPVAVIDYSLNGRSPNLIEDLCDGKEGSLVSRADRIRFDGRNSINIDGSSRMLLYDWKFPGGSISSNKDSSYKFDEINKEGECFSASLVVRDQVSGKLSEPDEVNFKVTNDLPQITDFVVTPPTIQGELVTPVKIQLNVINPKDNDGTVKKYRWWYYREGFPDEKLGINSTAQPLTDLTITSYGEPDTVNKYFFAVEIVDNDGGIFNSTERFEEVSYLDIKNGPNLSPVADFSVDKTTISVGDSMTFISKSYDPQGDILPDDAFRWDFDGDGEFDDISSGPQISRQFNTPGEFKVVLKVVYRGLSSSANKTVFVEATQTLPQAAFTYSTEGNTVSFDASNSRFDSSLEDKTLRYEWDFDVNSDANGNGIKDDDVQSTETKTTYAYTTKGIYKVKLKIKDMLGSEGVVVRDVNLNITQAELQKNSFHSLKVSSSKYAMTTLDLEIIPVSLSKDESADVNVRVLNADGTPYNGQVFFEITDGSGQFTPNPVTAADSRASSIFTATDAGKVRIKVRAPDTVHGELTEEATINVK